MTAKIKISDHDIPDRILDRGRRIGTATTEWADRTTRKARRRVRDAAYDADEYIRDHPAPFIAAACVASFAAGFLLSRALRRR